MALEIDNILHRKIILIFLSILAMSLLGSTAAAQSRDEVSGDLDKTDRLIERAEEVVRETGSEIGQSYLDHAYELQALAKDAYKGNRYQMTRKLTLAAREQATKAIGAVQESNNNASTVDRQIERTDEIIRRAQDVVSVVDNQKAASLLETALSTQLEAREFLKDGRLKIALTATLKARELAKKTIESAESDRGGKGLVERELHRTDELIVRAVDRADRLGSNGTVGELLQGAKEIQTTAYDDFRAGKLRAAMDRTERARDVTNKALKQIEEDVTPERVGKYIDQTERLISQAKELLLESPNSEAEKLLETAESYQTNASSSFSENSFETAIVEAKAARELVNKALTLIGG